MGVGWMPLPAGRFCALYGTCLKLGIWFSYICFFNLLKGSLKISRFCDLWILRYHLVHEVMSRSK